MYYRRNIQQQLNHRLTRLSNAFDQTYRNELYGLQQFIEKTPALRILVQELDRRHPEIEWTTWKEEKFTMVGLEMPKDMDEEVAAKMRWGLLRECVQQEGASWGYGHPINGASDTHTANHDLTQAHFVPLVGYLQSQLDEQSNVLYLLERYKRRAEWFNGPTLLAKMGGDPKKSEAIADQDVRAYLFDQGVDYPFSTPASRSGRADVVADVGDEQPLVLEIKLFDPARGYDRRYIRKGVRQSYRYTTDYGQPAGYLAIFNCTEQTLVLPQDPKDRHWPPRITIDDKTIYLVAINIASPSVSASKSGPLVSYIIDSPYLTDATYLHADPQDADESDE